MTERFTRRVPAEMRAEISWPAGPATGRRAPISCSGDIMLRKTDYQTSERRHVNLHKPVDGQQNIGLTAPADGGLVDIGSRATKEVDRWETPGKSMPSATRPCRRERRT